MVRSLLTLYVSAREQCHQSKAFPYMLDLLQLDDCRTFVRFEEALKPGSGKAYCLLCAES